MRFNRGKFVVSMSNMPEQIQKKKSMIPPVYFIIYLLAVIVLHNIFPITYLIPNPYRSAGVVLIIIGLSLTFWCVGIFNKTKTALKPFEKSSTLVIKGPFRFTRNPMYLGMVIALLGAAVFMGSLITFLAPLAFLITMNKIFIPAEEKMLRETFGEEYQKYISSVRRWV